MFYGENALFDFRTKKYLARIVTSPNQLVEKIQIFDAGKDDRIMELVKLLVTDSLHENNPDKEFAMNIFYSLDYKVLFELCIPI